MKKIYQLLALSLMAIMFSSCGYNSMVDKREEVNKTWANVQTQYQRRSDLIPKLAKVVKSYANFEQETLTKVIEARSKATPSYASRSFATSTLASNFDTTVA